MWTVARKLRLAAAVLFAGNTLCACGGTEGARYTLHGTSRAGAVAPASDMVLHLLSSWTESSSLDLSLTNADSSPSVSASAEVGPWSPALEPGTYEISMAFDLIGPEDGDEPSRLSIQATAESRHLNFWPTISLHEVGDEEDGWIPVHVEADFTDTSSSF